MSILALVKPDVPAGQWMPIQDAAEWYAVDPSTLYRMIRSGRLTRNKRSGDKRTYLLVAELERELRPKPVEERGDA